MSKNESEDMMTDEELLCFMKEQFETVCFGKLQVSDKRTVEKDYKGGLYGNQLYNGRTG